MSPPFLLSVLDQSPVAEGSTGAQALRNTIDLARLSDELGYHRYWVAEHHGGPMLAGPSPEALIGPIAAATSRIRVGSGGVMLPHYSPFKVAETFSLLAGLFPGRIDLALGRAAGTDPLTTFALQRDRRQAAPDDFPSSSPSCSPTSTTACPRTIRSRAWPRRLPGRPELPERWLLGSSQQSAIWAAELALPYAFADFINAGGAEIAALYRERFAEHEHAGRRQAAHGRRRVGDLRRQRRAGAAARRQRAHDLHAAASRRADRRAAAREGARVPRQRQARARAGQSRGQRRAVVGTPEAVRAELEDVVAKYGADEVIAVNILYDHQARRRSYELLAGAFEGWGDAATSRPRHARRSSSQRAAQVRGSS